MDADEADDPAFVLGHLYPVDARRGEPLEPPRDGGGLGRVAQLPDQLRELDGVVCIGVANLDHRRV
jgi:hypothetical protein